MTNRRDGRRAETVGFESTLDVWRRRKTVALLVFGTVFAAAVSITASLPDLYKATTTVLVETQHISEEFVRSSVSAELETRIQTIQQEIMSRARLSDIRDRFGLYPDLGASAPLEALIERMRGTGLRGRLGRRSLSRRPLG